MEFPRRYWRNLDWPLIFAVLILVVFGMIIIYSASYSRLISDGDDPFYFVKRQATGALMGIIGIVAILAFDYRAFKRWTKLLYVGNIALLTLVLSLGRTVFGSQRWFRFGPLSFQPSELAKLVIILVLAHYLEKKENTEGWKILNPFLLIGVTMGLILLQPDMGTSMVFAGMTFIMLYISGANVKNLLLIGGSGVVVMVTAIVVSLKGWVSIIKPYQLNRILVFLDPYSDRTRSGWNVIQSMIAVGSGRFLGKGLLSGSQNQLHFLPANHTDFVFSVIGEEFGFVGALMVLLLYLFIIWRGLRIAAMAKDSYGMLLASGVVGMLFLHLLINVGMTIGFMPVTGLPLLFITYGGNNLMIGLLAIGLLLNVGLRRNKIMF